MSVYFSQGVVGLNEGKQEIRKNLNLLTYSKNKNIARISRANVYVIQRRKGAISTEPGNRIAGAFTPAAVSYCLHCKNAANSDHMMLSLNSQGELCIIQTIIKIVMHKMLTMIVFCGIALAPFSKRR